MATVDERSRHDLYQAIEQLIGAEKADTLMALLPPVGWADVATKHDLDALEQRIDLRFENLDLRFEAFEHRLDAKLQRALRQQMLATFGAMATMTTILGSITLLR